MSINSKAYIVGAFEHPTRHAPDISLAQLHAEVAFGALRDAGLHQNDVDGYFCDSDAPGMGGTDSGGASGDSSGTSTMPLAMWL